ncbi:MAG: type IX secretion system sortase PorU [Prevotella sp.]|nr:type IX secretion system sortase PorU [Prevotella sp.]
MIHRRLTNSLLSAIAVATLVPRDVQAAAVANLRSAFFNLTTSEVRVADRLPVFEHEFALPADYQDSIYTVELSYPEYIDMYPADVARVKALGIDSLAALPQIDTYIGVERKKATLYAQLCPITMRDGRWQKLVSFKLELHSQPAHSAARNATGPRRAQEQEDMFASHSVLASGRWVKIEVSESGIHQLTQQLVQQAGFSDLSKVKIYGYGGALQPEKITAAYLRSTDDLKQVEQCVTANGRHLFYANGPVSWSSNSVTTRTRNPYSATGCYFLTDSGDEQQLTVSEETFLSMYGVTTASYHSLHETENYSWFHGGRNLYDSQLLTADGTQYTLQANGDEGRITLVLSYDGYFEAQLMVNDSLVRSVKPASNYVNVATGKLTDSYSVAASSSWVDNVRNLKAGNNVVTLKKTAGTANVRLDYVQLTLRDPKAAPDLNSATLPVPRYCYGITNQDHHADPQADMVIIIPTTQKLLAQAQRLKAWHEQHDSLRVNIVPADELYNEFSSGTPDANAYRRYLKMLYERAGSDSKQMPRYLLLMGDGAWDNRMLGSDWQSTSPDDFLLCYESENSFSETKCYVSDDFFTMLDEGEGANLVYTDKGDVAVGRLPARTAEDAKVMVDKTLSYAANEYAGAWQNTICMMGDDGNENLHMTDADTVAIMIGREHPAMNIKKIYWDAFQRQTSAAGNTYPDVTRLIKKQMQEGALVMNYTGHGSANQISHEKALLIGDFAESTSLRLPLWLTASCDVMPFDGQEETIGETAMLNKNGGAVAFFGTTRTVYSIYNRLMNKHFMHYVLANDADGKRISIGEAVRLAKCRLLTKAADNDRETDFTENKLQYSLLGDPALVLAMPTKPLTIDSINGHTTETATKLSAGSVVRIAGHIDNQPDFSGIVTLTMKDVEEVVSGRCNNGQETSDPFVFTDRTSTLYIGQDSVRKGRFNISFALPRDISYSPETGLITAYAVNNDHSVEVHGRSEAFTMDGTDTTDNTGKGPTVYCYLNKPSFCNGDAVNTTPYFYAELTDEDGINASGSGIGHDLQLIIDGKMATSYSLNEYFQYDFGDYRSGHVGYSIPALADGQHHLLFRAWDVLNNPTTIELDFNVQAGLNPTGIDIVSTRNPASTSTTFLISHDRIGSELNLVIDVFDTSGRQLWQHAETCVPDNSTYSVSWNLSTSQGKRLPAGIYVYRVRLASGGSDYASKSRKLIIAK